MTNLGASEMAELIAPLRVAPGSQVRLPDDFDPGYHAGFLKRDSKRLLKRGVELLAEYQSRLDRPDKNWKFSAADVTERGYWDDYQRAFSEMLSHTSTSWAPWYVIPADRKWFARICASAAIVNALVELDPRYPQVSNLGELAEARQALEEEAPSPR